MSKVYRRVGIANPGYSAFDLSYRKLFTCDMGMLIPVMCDEVIPGDSWSIGNEVVVRMQPLVAPVLHEIYTFVHYFFVPYRLLMTTGLGDASNWEDYISGGEDGTDSSSAPTWSVTSNAVGSLWDYFGFPISVDCAGAKPSDFPKRAYNFIWNQWYRDEFLQSEVNITTSEALLYRNWMKDRFTTAKTSQQLGTSPALPITISGDGGNIQLSNTNDATARTVNTNITTGDVILGSAPSATGNARWADPGLQATSVDINELRLSMQIQKWMERNFRAGVRYREFLLSHYGVSANNGFMDIPQFIGGSRNPLIISEVLNTSAVREHDSNSELTPQGQLAGHGITVDRRFIAKWRAKEHGLIMGIMSIMPKPAYHQGVDKQWLKSSKYDFYFPEFANLSEDAIIRAELYANSTSGDNTTIFGYSGQYDEHRVKQDRVCGDMHSTYDYWHCTRQFGSAPTLNSAFISTASTPIPRKDIFAAPSVHGFIVNFGNVVKAVRPMPIMANPSSLGE